MSEKFSVSEKNIAFSLCGEVSCLSQPLYQKLSINAFCYSRIYDDGSRIELWTDARALKHTFIDKGYLNKLYTPAMLSCGEKYCVLNYKVQQISATLAKPLARQLQDRANYFQQDHGFLLALRGERYVEFFKFFAHPAESSIINDYIVEIALLEAFAGEFKERASPLIQQVEQQKLVLPWRQKDELCCQDNLHKSLEIRTELTAREKQVAYQIYLGKTAPQIANFIGLSHRTVESHVEHLKIKLNVRNRVDLILKISKLYEARLIGESGDKLFTT